MINRVAVVGGGVAGLYAAWRLLNKKLAKQVDVYEKAERWGGRLLSVEHDGLRMEAGGSRFHSGHRRFMRLLKALGISKDDWYQLQADNKTYVKNSKLMSGYNVDAVTQRILRAAEGVKRGYLRGLSLEMWVRQVLGTPEEAEDYMAAFGYNSLFETMSAWVGLRELRESFGGGMRYWVMKRGMGSVIEALVGKLEVMEGFKGHLGVGVMEYKAKDGAVVLEGGKVVAGYDKVVFALTKPQLLGVKGLTEADAELRRSLRGVYDTPAHRIYARFPVDAKTGKAWFAGMDKVTTNSPLRYVIPISSKTGLCMISYMDGKYAFMWKDIEKGGERALMKAIMLHVRRLFPRLDIPDPLWLKSFHWNCAVHYWAPHSKRYVNKPEKRHVVVGEVMSEYHPGWIEGALETVDKVF